MTDQAPSDELTAENELICEKLLGWKRRVPDEQQGAAPDLIWLRPFGFGGLDISDRTPSFTSWADAGLILEAFAARDVACDLYQDGEWSIGFYGKHSKCHTRASETGPLAVRSAALAYIRSLP